MTRILKTVMSLVLGGTLFVGTACEDQKCKEDLQAATTASETAQKSLTAKQAELTALNGRLAAAQAEVAKLKKEAEDAKAAAAKPAEPAPAPAAKKGKK
jgi:molecular chaperone GrpE (heat shock protein)